MPQTDRIRRALRSWVFAMLIAFVPINVIGFASPFVAHLRGEPTQSRALLEAAQGFAPLLWLVFLWPAWHLSRAQVSPGARAAVLAGGALVPAARWIEVTTLRGAATDGGTPVVVATFADLWLGAALLAFVWLCGRALRAPAIMPARAPGS